MILFTKHAREKFALLLRHGVEISEHQVIEALERPEIIDHSRKPLLIAQVAFDERRVLRVVFKQERDVMKVITFYPGRRKQYEDKNSI